MEKIAEKSCIGFVDVLGSKAPVPGGDRKSTRLNSSHRL